MQTTTDHYSPNKPAKKRDFRDRRLPVGAECIPDGGVHFRVWAPARQQVTVVFERSPDGANPPPTVLTQEPDGYFSALVAEGTAGSRYRFRLDDEPALYPDPVSRWQPEGVEGPSEVVDPAAYSWRDSNWPGISLAGQVIYEMHIGTFTPEGTWAAAIAGVAPARRDGRHRVGSDAGRRISRVASAGVTTASICSLRRGSTARPTIFAASSIARTSMAWA